MWKTLTNVHLKDTERDVKVTLRWNIQKGGFVITCRCFGVETSYKCALGRHRKRCESNIEMEYTVGGIHYYMQMFWCGNLLQMCTWMTQKEM